MTAIHRSVAGARGKPDGMSPKAAITVNRPRADVERLWADPAHGPSSIQGTGAAVTFTDAPGDRGTEIHVDLGEDRPGGRLGELVHKATAMTPLAKVKDELRRFKQLAETGVIPRSDGAPEGERVARKLKQRPAQPLADAELEKAGA
jgi:hypothetical protein